MNAGQLLAIPVDRPECLFARDMVAAKREFRKLRSRWHPDHCGDAQAATVFHHIQALYDRAAEKIAAGTWSTPGLLLLTAKDGRTFEIRHARQHAFELGDMYVGKTVVAFVIASAHADLVRNATAALGRLTYRDETMRAQMARLLPPLPLAATFEIAGATVVVMKKTPDVLLLRDVLTHFGGKIDAKHVAWIISRAMNLACYLHHTGIVHNAISVDTVFISPQQYTALLLGGWWYARRQGERMLAAPARTIAHAPPDLLATKMADVRTDLELIRAMGRELLGDVIGTRLPTDTNVPAPMVNWLRSAAPADPVADYSHWQNKVLKDSFGVRRFVELPLTHSDIYQ